MQSLSFDSCQAISSPLLYALKEPSDDENEMTTDSLQLEDNDSLQKSLDFSLLKKRTWSDANLECDREEFE